MILRPIFAGIAALACAVAALSQSMAPVNGYPAFAIGGDFSSMQQVEDLGTPVFYRGTDPVPADIVSITDMAADYALDAVRLRVWVNPSEKMALSGFSFSAGGYSYQVMSTGGYCSPDDLLAAARRFAALGMRVMVCFHLSDTWADPARQFIPASWRSCTTAAQLSECVNAHIVSVLSMLRDADVNVAWVQIGNETSTGMLKYQLPSASGSAVSEVAFGATIASSGSTTRNFVSIFSAAASAARSVYPDARIVLHLPNATNWTAVNWTLSLLKSAGFFSASCCDYVGLSLYPCTESNVDYTARWKPDAERALATIRNVWSSYGLRTLICETGMNNEYSLSADQTVAADVRQAVNIDQCNRDVRAFTEWIMASLKDDDSSTCDGVFYWDPATDYLHDYKKGACYSITPGPSWPRSKVTANPWWQVCRENSSFPDGGLTDFVIGPSDPSAVSSLDAGSADGPVTYFNLQGVPLSSRPRGVCIERSASGAARVVLPVR